MTLLEVRVNRASPTSRDKPHHVYASPKSSWSTYLSTWITGSDRADAETKQERLIGFRNPWPSWHKPTPQQTWDAFEWGEDEDPCIRLAASHSPEYNDKTTTRSFPAFASELLSTETTDFVFDPSREKCKLTWLGHAGMLLQLRPLQSRPQPQGRPFRCLFDPLFSMRCSPSQLIGPLRTYPPPCNVSDLPEIDLVMISHDHYDHLDFDTIVALWKHNQGSIRFLVPLKNAAWLASCGIPSDRIIELDWWDSIRLTTDDDLVYTDITCTPSQHNSGRGGAPPNSTLWSSWFVHHNSPDPFCTYFAGDTGFQFHDSSNWPPVPAWSGELKLDEERINGGWPTCPAFEMISQRLGVPDVVILPIAVGATYDYLRSFVPLPNSVSPFPRHRPGLTAANHMPPWDAVRVFLQMTKSFQSGMENPPVAIAMHWGTFVTDPVEILKTLGQLETGCDYHDVTFARSLNAQLLRKKRHFLALNHGQSVTL